MYEYISGKLTEKRATEAVVDVLGIGFALKISLSTFEKLPEIGETVSLKTYLHVREDLLQLFGFIDEEERTIFNGLISISGVGPKLAQTILSGLTPKKLVSAVRSKDERALSSITGVGKKTAQRLIVELKDKFEKLIYPGVETEQESPVVILNDIEQEALMALLSLGYNRFSAEKSINKIKQSEKVLTVEEYIKKALQHI
jgi:Holliday junction DNA helicase RuvA